MPPLRRFQVLCGTALAALVAFSARFESRAAGAPELLAGAATTDISPTVFPVRVNAMFTERWATQTVDRLHVRALVLKSGAESVAIAVVDTCMMARDLIDQAKSLARERTGLAVDRILVSATHTHSAPSAMGCLGSRQDPRYAALLPGQIAEAIALAHARLRPAEMGWGVTNAWNHTFNRRWIRRPDRLLTDPFGSPSVRAHMHPGHQSPEAIGPSGPVDPALSMIAFRTPQGHPIAVLANFSQHYYDSPLLSSDYYGRFAQHLATHLAPHAHADLPEFVPIMSQGTSGDLMWMDYGTPRRDIGYDAYAREISDRVAALYRNAEFRPAVPLRMAEAKLDLAYRTPGPDRLAWARNMAQALGDQLPQTLPQIYALESIHLHQRQRTELVLQALRIGEVGLTALPNEVFALTGLKLKAASPLPVTFNIELANGAEGYIPPPEQHVLGGYTTWPARTAGLDVQAEPRIVESLLHLLETVSGQPRRDVAPPAGHYARAVLDTRPDAYWRLEEMSGPTARDDSGHQRAAILEPGVALYLPGPGSGDGLSPDAALRASAFSDPNFINRAIHCAGGRLRASLPGLGSTYSVSFWFWNGLATTNRQVTGYLFSRGTPGDPQAQGDHLGIGGTSPEVPAGRLFFYNGNRHRTVLPGRTPIPARTWHQVTLVREGNRVRVHLNGHPEPEIEGDAESTLPWSPNEIFFGGRSDGFAGLEGRLDEVAVHARALSTAEIVQTTRASELALAVPLPAPQPSSPPLSPAESLARLHVAPGFVADLVAAEPLVLDPVAFDWDAQGRLWVVEMADYPMGMDGQGKPGGRVRVLSDTNGDGVYDDSRVFADGLRFPNGLLVWRDGILVTAAPEVLFLRDANGDGIADSTEVLLSGFLEGNQQLRVNGLRWGVDNWVYCAAGGHHRGHGAGTRVRSHRAGTEIALGSRDFRFRPDTGEIEPESGPSQFGRNPDDWGRWFGTQNSWPLWHYVLPDRYLRRNPHVPAPDPVTQIVRPMNPKVFPASAAEKRFHNFQEAGHFTSACAGTPYRDDLVFPRRETGHALICEPFHNLVHHTLVQPDGFSFLGTRADAESQREWLASEDRWFRPVMTRTGPDGAIWVADMYRYMIEHPDWLPAEGRAELLPHYRQGDDRGRIYRIRAAHPSPRPVPPLDSRSALELVDLLGSPNGWLRDHAQQRLLWARDPVVLPALRRIAAPPSPPLARIHALWTLHGLGALTEEPVLAALQDAHPRLREHALRLAESSRAESLVRAATALTGDPDPGVRLQLALSLGEWRGTNAGDALTMLAFSKDARTQPQFLGAILSSALPHAESLFHAARRQPQQLDAALFDSLAQLALGLESSSGLDALLAPCLDTAQESAALPTAEACRRFQRFLLLAGQRPQAREWSQRADHLFARARLAVARPADDTDAQERNAAAELLLRTEAFQGEGIHYFLRQLTPQRSPDTQLASLRALQGCREPALASSLIARWPETSTSVRPALLDLLLARPEWSRSLANALASRTIAPAHVDAARRARLLRHSDPDVRTLAETAFDQVAPAQGRADVVAAYRPALSLAGQAPRGRAHFMARCASCHRRGADGQDLGPDLISVIQHAPEKLLVNILDPNADVQPGYHAFTCTLIDGEEVYGLITAETANSLLIKKADGSIRTLLRSEIASLRGSDLSLMPEGLEAGLTLQELSDLIAFLRSPL